MLNQILRAQEGMDSPPLVKVFSKALLGRVLVTLYSAKIRITSKSMFNTCAGEIPLCKKISSPKSVFVRLNEPVLSED